MVCERLTRDDKQVTSKILPQFQLLLSDFSIIQGLPKIENQNLANNATCTQLGISKRITHEHVAISFSSYLNFHEKKKRRII